jgi:uroporphyrinogen-III synthase
VTVGGPDAAALVASLAGEGRVLHLAGREHRGDLPEGGVRRVVYAADAVTVLPDAARGALAAEAVALLHSPRAAALFGELVDAAGVARGSVAIGALSGAVAGAAGAGWRDVCVAAVAEDVALLRAVGVAAR